MCRQVHREIATTPRTSGCRHRFTANCKRNGMSVALKSNWRRSPHPWRPLHTSKRPRPGEYQCDVFTSCQSSPHSWRRPRFAGVAQAQGDQGRGRGRGHDKRRSKTKRIKEEQRRTDDYRRHLDEQTRVAQQQAAQLQQAQRRRGIGSSRSTPRNSSGSASSFAPSAGTTTTRT